jgi:hypothetical protein
MRSGVEGLAVEMDMGSATSWGRHPDRTWLVRVRRGDRSVIVAWGLNRAAAQTLAEQITAVIGDAAPKGAAGGSR